MWDWVSRGNIHIHFVLSICCSEILGIMFQRNLLLLVSGKPYSDGNLDQRDEMFLGSHCMVGSTCPITQRSCLCIIVVCLLKACMQKGTLLMLELQVYSSYPLSCTLLTCILPSFMVSAGGIV